MIFMLRGNVDWHSCTCTSHKEAVMLRHLAQAAVRGFVLHTPLCATHSHMIVSARTDFSAVYIGFYNYRNDLSLGLDALFDEW